MEEREREREREREAGEFLTTTIRLICPWIITCPRWNGMTRSLVFPAETLLAFLTSLLRFFFFFSPVYFYFAHVCTCACVHACMCGFFFSLSSWSESSLIPFRRRSRHCGESHCQRHLIIESRTKTFCDFIWGTMCRTGVYAEGDVPRGNAKAVGNFSRFYFRVRLGLKVSEISLCCYFKRERE